MSMFSRLLLAGGKKLQWVRMGYSLNGVGGYMRNFTVADPTTTKVYGFAFEGSVNDFAVKWGSWISFRYLPITGGYEWVAVGQQYFKAYSNKNPYGRIFDFGIHVDEDKTKKKLRKYVLSETENIYTDYIFDTNNPSVPSYFSPKREITLNTGEKVNAYTYKFECPAYLLQVQPGCVLGTHYVLMDADDITEFAWSR